MATVIREGSSEKPKGWFPTRGQKIKESEWELGEPYIIKGGKKLPAQMSVTGWRQNANSNQGR